MPPEIPLPDVSTFAVWGPLGVIFAIGVYFSLRYGHRILDGHIAFMDTAKTTQTTLAESFKSLSERDEGHAKTHQALGHAFHAAKEITTCADAHRHLDRAIDSLQ